MDELLVKSLPSRNLGNRREDDRHDHKRLKAYHGEYMFGSRHQALHENGFVVRVLKELLHLRWQLFDAVATNGVYAHRLGKLDKVRVHHARVCVSGIVEKICANAT